MGIATGGGMTAAAGAGTTGSGAGAGSDATVTPADGLGWVSRGGDVSTAPGPDEGAAAAVGTAVGGGLGDAAGFGFVARLLFGGEKTRVFTLHSWRKTGLVRGNKHRRNRS